MKKQKLVPGDIFQISGFSGKNVYGRVLPEAFVAIYSGVFDDEIEVSDLLSNDIIFKVPVMNYAITSGRWKVVNHVELSPELLKPIKLFKRDRISKKLYIYERGEQRPATKEEVRNLECAAVWEPEHVEQRISDYLSGRENKTVKLFQSYIEDSLPH